MAKDVDEETNRTKAEPTQPAQASRDDETTEEAVEAKTEELENEGLEYKETVDVPPPEDAGDKRDYEDKVREHDDPRQLIAKKHDEKHRNFGETEEKEPEKAELEPETDESDVETEESADIIDIEEAKKPEMVEVKIYGETKMVEKAKVDKAGGIQAYQKQLAVAYGQQEVAERRKQLDSREEALARREADIAAKEAALPVLGEPQTQADLPTPGDQKTIEEQAKAYNEALLDGDESAPGILANLIAQNKQSAEPLDVNAIIQKAADELDKRNRVRKEKQATAALMVAHPELKDDERLFMTVDAESAVVERENPDWEPDAILEEAYRRVSDWRGISTEQSDDDTSLQEKQAQKRAIKRPVASTRRAPAPPEPPTRTDSDYIADLRKARGLE